MTTVTTDLRSTIESARRIRYEPTLPITATDVQTAINQAITISQTVVTTAVTSAMSPYAPTNNDSYLAVDTTAGPVTINLQPGFDRAGLALVIKDISGTSGANPISLVPSGAETVDGLAPYPIDSAYAAVELYSKAAGGYAVAP